MGGARGSRSLSERTLRGVAILLTQNLASRAVTFGSQLILAWFLMPADFGLVGLAGVITNFVSTLQYFGVEDVLLQRSRNLRFWAGTAYRMSLIMGVLSGLLVLVSAPIAAQMFKSHELLGMLCILAIAMPLNALTTVPATQLRADMRFGIVATYNAVENLGLSAATVLLAWRGYGAYSFVIPVPVFNAVKAASFGFWAPLPKMPRQRKRIWKLLLGRSLAVFWTRVINGAIGQGDYFLLGLVGSHAIVGIYYFAFRLASQPILILAANLNAVIYPALLQLQADETKQYEAALKAANLLNHCVFFLGFLQAAVAHPVLESLFGPKWASAVPLIQLLSVALAFDAASWIAGSLLAARGEFSRSLRYIAVLGSLFFVFVAIGACAGAALGTATGVCAYYIITQPIYTYRIFRAGGIPFIKVAAIYFKPMLIAALAVGAGLGLGSSPLIHGSGWLRAVVVATVSVVAFILLIRRTAPDLYDDVSRRLVGALRAGRPHLIRS